MTIPLLLLLVGAVGACVENGYGEDDGEGGCRIVYCGLGHEPRGGVCAPCEKGRFSAVEGLEACEACPAVPQHAEATRFGETGPACRYRCHPGTVGRGCKTWYALLWPPAFVVMGVSAFCVFVRRVQAHHKER